MTKRHPHRRLQHALVFLLALGAFAAASAPGARASAVGETKRFGLGGILGNPTGLTLKYHFTPKHALTAELGIGWWAGQNFHISVDYGYHFNLTRQPDFDLVLSIGGGLKFFFFYYHYHPYWADPDRDYSRAGLGLRVPIGLAFNLNRVPLEIFLEIAPGFAFLPWLDGFVDGGVGVRYYF